MSELAHAIRTAMRGSKFDEPDLSADEYAAKVGSIRASAAALIPTGLDAADFLAAVPGDRGLMERMGDVFRDVLPGIGRAREEESAKIWRDAKREVRDGEEYVHLDSEGAYQLRDSMEEVWDGPSGRRAKNPFELVHAETVLRELGPVLEPVLEFPVDAQIPMIWGRADAGAGEAQANPLEFPVVDWLMAYSEVSKAMAALAVSYLKAGEHKRGVAWLGHLTALVHVLVPVRMFEYLIVVAQRERCRSLVNGLARHGHVSASEAGALRAAMRKWPLDGRLAAAGEVLYCLESVRVGGGPVAFHESVIKDDGRYFTLRESIEVIDQAVAVLEGQQGAEMVGYRD